MRKSHEQIFFDLIQRSVTWWPWWEYREQFMCWFCMLCWQEKGLVYRTLDDVVAKSLSCILDAPAFNKWIEWQDPLRLYLSMFNPKDYPIPMVMDISHKIIFHVLASVTTALSLASRVLTNRFALIVLVHLNIHPLTIWNLCSFGLCRQTLVFRSRQLQPFNCSVSPETLFLLV